LSEGSFVQNVVVNIPKFDANPNPSPNSNPSHSPNPNCKPMPILFGQMTLQTSELLSVETMQVDIFTQINILVIQFVSSCISLYFVKFW